MTFPERLRKPGYRYLAALLLLGVLASAPWWGRNALRRMAFFRVRMVEIRGTRYLQPNDVVAGLRVDTLRSIWDGVGPLEARLRRHPQVADVAITRKLPGTLVVTVTENLPVALVPTGDGLQPYDSAGRALPIDPSRTTVDLPIALQRDPAILGFLGRLKAARPTIYDRVSEVWRASATDMVVEMTPTLRVRAMIGVAAGRFADIFPVETDLARRQARVAELDLRYRDQVIARLQ